MLKKLLIRTWFGPLPSWTEQWRKNTEMLKPYGWDFLLVNDYRWFRQCVIDTLGVEIAPLEQIGGTRKAGDFDPAYGAIFAEELRGYDYWGHTALDNVFGRLDHWLTDDYLSKCDVFGNDPGAICGPLSVYANKPHVVDLFRNVTATPCKPVDVIVREDTDLRPRSWVEIFADPNMFGFDEIQFNEQVQQASNHGEIRFKSAFWQGQPGRVRRGSDGELIDTRTGKEVMMAHFNKRTWPARTWPVAE